MFSKFTALLLATLVLAVSAPANAAPYAPKKHNQETLHEVPDTSSRFWNVEAPPSS